MSVFKAGVKKLDDFWGGKCDFDVFSWRAVAGGDNFGVYIKTGSICFTNSLRLLYAI